MRHRAIVTLPALLALLLSAGALVASAQVATLQTPGPGAEASRAPVEPVDEEEALLRFVGCLRDNGVEIPDPQFGPEGVRFTDPTALLRIDIRSSAFLDALEACAEYLEALRPAVDPEQQAEQIEQYLEFAECMRREGIDFPDPDPVRGFTVSSIRGPDGDLAVDPFSADFIRASGVCTAEVGLPLPGAPGAP